MPHSQADVAADLCQVLVESWAVNERMNQIVLEHLDPAAWRAKPPGNKGRTIAAIVAHVHNIRRKWLRLSAPHLRLPAPLDLSGLIWSSLRESWIRIAVCLDSLLLTSSIRSGD